MFKFITYRVTGGQIEATHPAVGGVPRALLLLQIDQWGSLQMYKHELFLVTGTVPVLRLK